MFRDATYDPFSDWLTDVASRVRMPDAELRWRCCDANGSAIADHDASATARRYATSASAAAWADIRGAAEHPPREALRAGTGPRYGIHDDIRWAASRAHSARAKAAVAGFLVQRSRAAEWLLFGIDIERQDRPLRPHVSHVICPRKNREALPILQVGISMLAVTCLKEAVFKSDAAQPGRAVWDYDIVALEPAGTAGWAGCVQAIDEERPRFHVAVHRIASYWVAMSVAVTSERFLAASD